MSELLDVLKKEEVRQFIFKNVYADVNKLLLNPPKPFKEHIKLIADQILARQKAKGKFDIWAKMEELIMPPPVSIEQASSELTAQYKKSLIKGKWLVDLTGGMGIDCLTLSDNFNQTTYIEQNPTLCTVFSHNSKVFEKIIEVKNEDAFDFLASINEEEDAAIFLDPARRDGYQNKVFQLQDCSPNVLDLLPSVSQKVKQVLVKLSPLVDISSIMEEVANVKELHIVSVKNECKEILLLIDFSFTEEAVIKCVNLCSGDVSYTFKRLEEQEVASEFNDTQTYLYEPNSSILKAGAFKKIGRDYGLKKLHQHTHLYTASEIVSAWPGRTFEVVSERVDKKVLKKFAPKGVINVLTRNYPLNAKGVKAKYSVNDGGDYFLMGFRDRKEKSKLVIGKKIN